MSSKIEKLNAAANSGAKVSQSCAAAEPAEAHGTYNVLLTGPVEHMREKYIALRDRLLFKGWRGFIDRIVNGRRLVAEFLAIPVEVKWADIAENVVTTVGKNLALDTYLAGSGYTVVGPYMGLAGSGASSAVAGDTMASHAAWTEVGGTNAPAYSGTRKTCAWSSASSGSKALSSALSFAITSSGTVGGCFIVFGAGAVATLDSTAGTLYSAGAFSGGSKTVSNGDTLNVSYTASL